MICSNRIVDFILNQPVQMEVIDAETYERVLSSIINKIELTIPSIKIDYKRALSEIMFKVYKHKNTLGLSIDIYTVKYNDEIFFFMIDNRAYILNKEIYELICKKIFIEYSNVVVDTKKFEFDNPNLDNIIEFRNGCRTIHLDEPSKMKRSEAIKKTNDITELFAYHIYKHRESVSFIPEILNKFTMVTNDFWSLFNKNQYTKDNRVKIEYYHDLHNPLLSETEEESGILYFDNKEVFAFYFYGVYCSKPDSNLYTNVKTLQYVKFTERRIIDADAYTELCNYMYELRNSDRFIHTLNIDCNINEYSLMKSILTNALELPFKFDYKEYNSFYELSKDFNIDITKLISLMKNKIKNESFTNVNDLVLDYLLNNTFEFRGVHYKDIQSCCEQLGIGDLYNDVKYMNNDEESIEYVLLNQDNIRHPNLNELPSLFKNIMGERISLYDGNPNTILSCLNIYSILDEVEQPYGKKYRPRNLKERKVVACNLEKYFKILAD